MLAINPVTSLLVKYYETEKAQYSRDVDHLISVNRNGVWIKEIDNLGYKIINAKKLNIDTLEDVSIYVFDSNHKLLKRLDSESALITNNPWQMKNIYIYNIKENNVVFFENYQFKSDNILEKINSLYRNLNTISFFSLTSNYLQLNEKGYSKKLLNEKINRFISLPIFLFLMVVLAAIFTVGSLKNKQNFYYILISILTCVAIYYFKDFSVALGKTGKIDLILSVWMPVIIVSLFCAIGVIQINEK